MNITDNIIDKQPVNQSLFNSEQSGKWFDELIATIRTHQLVLETDLADQERKKFYELMMIGSEFEVAGMSHGITTTVLIKTMLVDYLKELNERGVKPVDIAFDNTNSGLLVWSVINDNDEDTENNLLLSAAKVNAKFNQYGFAISSTILEKSDEHPIPEHYQSVVNY
jgi:hypothetical protein